MNESVFGSELEKERKKRLANSSIGSSSHKQYAEKAVEVFAAFIARERRG